MSDSFSDNGYVFKQSELSALYGSPVMPYHPPLRRFAYLSIGIFVLITGTLFDGLISANKTTIAGYFHFTPAQTTWYISAYYMVYGMLSGFMFRFRQNLGSKIFLRFSSFCYISAIGLIFLGYYLNSFSISFISRFFQGLAANCSMAIGVYYIRQYTGRTMSPMSVIFIFSAMQLGAPIGNAVSPWIMPNENLLQIFGFLLILSIIVVASITILPMPPARTLKTYEWLDFVSFTALVILVACTVIFYTQVQVGWWEQTWLIWPCVIGLCATTVFLIVEKNRNDPILPISWLFSREVLIFVACCIGLRLCLAEQSMGALGLLGALGYTRDNFHILYAISLLSCVSAIIFSAIFFNPTKLQAPIMIALTCIALACFLDTRSTINSAPQDFYFTQALYALAVGLFFAPLFVEGFARAASVNPLYVLSFLCVLVAAQVLGSTFGTAIIDLITKIFTQFHYNQIADHILIADPRIVDYIDTTAKTFSAYTSDASLINSDAVSQLAKNAHLQAQVEAYRDVFTIIGFFTLALLVSIIFRDLYYRFNGTFIIAKEAQEAAQNLTVK